MMFWDSKYGQGLLEELDTRLNSAHNGYLEIYLDGGLIGLLLLFLMLVGGGWTVIGRLLAGGFHGRIGFAFWIIALVYNLTESNFFRLGPLWFTLLLSMVETPGLLVAAVPSETVRAGPVTSAGGLEPELFHDAGRRYSL